MKPFFATLIIIGIIFAGIIVGLRLARPSKDQTEIRWRTVAPKEATGFVRSVRIVREVNAGPAPQIKSFLISRLPDTPQVHRAYFVDVDYGVDKNTACLLDFDPSTTRSETNRVIRKYMDALLPFIKDTKLSLDILPLPRTTTVPQGVKPFYERSDN